jgi:hypothetical protein
MTGKVADCCGTHRPVASASQYLAISAAYTEVNAAAAKQIELAEKSLSARQAEGKAAMDLAAQFGTNYRRSNRSHNSSHR